MSEFYTNPVNFNYLRYASTKEDTLQRSFTDSMADRGMYLEFTHVPTGKSIYFKAFITTFAEAYKPSWATEQVLGHMDPIYMFKNTKRTISLAFVVPAENKGEAYENLGRVQQLSQFLYPTYKDPAQAQTIVQSPLVRLKVMNLVRDCSTLTFNNALSEASMFDEYDFEGSGLLGTIPNISIDHNLAEDTGVIEKGNKTGLQAILPKAIEITLDFDPIHEHPVGWDEHDQFGVFKNEEGQLFPYGVQLKDYDPPAGSKAEQNTSAADTKIVGQATDGSANLSEGSEVNPVVQAFLDGTLGDDIGEGPLSGIVVPYYGADGVAVGPDGTPWDEYWERQELLQASQAAIDEMQTATEMMLAEVRQARDDAEAKRKADARAAEKRRKEKEAAAAVKPAAEADAPEPAPAKAPESAPAEPGGHYGRVQESQSAEY